MTKKSKKKKAQNQKKFIRNTREQPRGSEVENSIAGITKGTESSPHIEDPKPVELPLQQQPVSEVAQDPEKQHLTVTDSPKEGPFRRRIRALTGGSNRSSTAENRQSWESKSSSTKSSRIWLSPFRDSGMSQDGEGKSPKRKKSEDASPTPGVLRYIRSPHDYMFIDLDYLEAMNNGLNSGLPDGENGEDGQSDGKPPAEPAKCASLAELILYVRRVTGTEIKPISLTDPKVCRRHGDARAWNHRNLWCISCYGTCPRCNKATCCLREEALVKVHDGSLGGEDLEKAKRLVKIIEFLGPHAKDATTFSQCSPPDGCGCHVCPNCCGVCPNEICRDVQCVMCKDDPWGTCDWHE